jgi:hypothetical protein
LYDVLVAPPEIGRQSRIGAITSELIYVYKRPAFAQYHGLFTLYFINNDEMQREHVALSKNTPLACC